MEAGGKLGDAQSPWLKLAHLLATYGIQLLNWHPDCPYPPDSKKDRGIEGALTHELRALVAQYSDASLPLSAQRVDNVAHQRGIYFQTSLFVHMS